MRHTRLLLPGMFAAALFLSGCDGQEVAQMQARLDRPRSQYVDSQLTAWRAREASFNSSLAAGMTMEEVLAVWGGAGKVQRSVVGETHIDTLIYSRYVSDSGIITDRPIHTYHLVFTDGRLSEFHKM